eukprot:1153891-Pelagomonas_calceolata.AAC.2
MAELTATHAQSNETTEQILQLIQLQTPLSSARTVRGLKHTVVHAAYLHNRLQPRIEISYGTTSHSWEGRSTQILQ